MTTRRRVITILAGAAALPVVGAKASAATNEWNGIALGASAQIILQHENSAALIQQAVNEIQRLEQIFSLYKANSQISQLNRDGALDNPAFEFVELLSICSIVNARTNGAFDPTVQTLWSLYADKYSAGLRPTNEQISNAMGNVGWSNVVFSANGIEFRNTGTAITLNGIAQGYIADKVAELFKKNGVRNVLVNTGEIAAVGSAPSGENWTVRLRELGKSVSLSNASIATSSPLGTTFDADGRTGHILDPRTGYPNGGWKEVSVISKSAAVADGLSTAFCLMQENEIIATIGSEKVLLG